MTTTDFAGTRACVFDAYGTLFDFNAAVARCRDEVGPQADRLSALWRDKQIQYTWLRSLMGRYAPFWQVTGEALDYCLETLAITKPALRDRLMAAYRELDAFPEVPAVLDSLKAAGYPLAILSNGSPEMLDAAVNAARLGDRLDAVLSVAEVSIFKPHPSVYKLAVDRLGVPAETICFLSSNAWDAAGAAAFGFRVVWINRGRLPAERLPDGPRATIATLAELPALLGVAA
ncbi:MAG: haloacid dehalogenase type II [Alphaproteobacteria bacterium]